MAATREAGAYVDVDSGGRKVAMDGALAHKHKFSNYVADDAALEVSLLPDEGYVYVTTSGSGGTVKLNLPDVSVARGRVYTVVFTKVTSNLTVGIQVQVQEMQQFQHLIDIPIQAMVIIGL